MTTSLPSADGGPGSSHEVERVREIIFGPQMRDYDQRFAVIRRDLDRLRLELEQLAEQASDRESEQNKRAQALRREMRQADDDTRAELRQVAQKLGYEKVDRFALGDLLIEMGRHLKEGSSLTRMLGGVIQQLDEGHDQGTAAG